MSSKGGLTFLNKKSWHTAKVQNIEKVWIAEQKSLEENKRTEQLKKELEEEREMEELRRLQEESGLITKKRVEMVDWLYEAPRSAPSSEDFLTGKSIPKIDIKESDFDKMKDNKSAGSLLTLGTGNINSRLELENRLRDDPLMMMKKSELNAKEYILANPRKMDQIRKTVETLQNHQDKNHKKNHHHHHHHHKKQKKEKDKHHHHHHHHKKQKVETENDHSIKKDHNFPNITSSIPLNSSLTGYGLVVNSESQGPLAKCPPPKPQPLSQIKQNSFHRDRSKNSSKYLSAEEKQKKLEEMQKDANDVESQRITRYHKDIEIEKNEKEKHENESRPKKSYLLNLTEKAFLDQDSNLEDRLKRNRFYQQKI